MRNLLACTCLTPILLFAGTERAGAETVISSKITSPVRTSTIKSGSADDIRISADGSIVPSTAGAAVTIDSNHSVKNEGTITITDLDDSAGILAKGGTAGTITNTGKIEVIESYTPGDSDKDGDNDGAFATGARRYGIRIAPPNIIIGEDIALFTGSIVNSGTINVEGNDSAGIAVDSRLDGSINSSGTITVVGDRAVGVRAGEVTGDVRLSGTVTATGLNAIGAALDGNIGGALVVQGGLASTGYRSTTAPSDTSKLDSDDLLQGGPALRVAGNVAKGILFDAPPPDKSSTDNDEDKDGVDDSKEGIASIVSSGAAPAVQIGAAEHSVTIGAVAGNANGHGIVVNGGISGRGVYKGVDASALVIGGLGGAVDVAGGLTVNGQVVAQSNGATATAVRIGSGASVNELRVAGTVQADGGSLGRAIQIDQGANVTAIRNSGMIASSAADSAEVIVDKSGKLSLVENSGAIRASGVAFDSGRGTAIDLRTNSSGATIRQTQVGQGVAAPLIAGNILFGAGDDLLDLADGEVKGETQFGTGANRLILSGDAIYRGNVQFGGGQEELALSGTARFSGALINAANLAVRVNGGTLDVTSTGPVAIGSLAVGSTGVLAVTIDPAAGKSTSYQVAGAASFAEGAKLQVKLANLGGSLGKYVVLKAGSLTGTGGLTATPVLLPIFLKSSLSANEQSGEIAVTVGRKTASELGLNQSEERGWDAMFGALDKDSKVAGAFLEMTDAGTLRDAIQQMLPEHAGGVFETVTQGSRATARLLRDPAIPFVDRGGWGFWLQQVAWGTSKNLGDTSSYDITGWGVSGGAEVKLGGAGRAGLSLAYLAGRDEHGGNDNEVSAGQYELAAYWRGEWGGLRAHLRASAAMIDFEGARTFTGKVGNEIVSRTAEGKWDGRLYSAAGGLSYGIALGRLSLRPALALDYYRLSEDGYTETGGGDAIDLTVGKRTSDELAGEGSLAIGFDFWTPSGDGPRLRAEIEGGRRQILGGSIGETVARFGTGPDFTLLPEERSDGWIGKVRLMGGNSDFSIGGEFNAEEQQGRAAIAFRVALQAAL